MRLPTRLLGVWAHPDDEAYLAAGLMARVARAGGIVRCVTATWGEAGFAADDPRPLHVRAAVREREVRSSLDLLGVREHVSLGHADGRCDALPDGPQVARIMREIDDLRPEVVVTFGPDGVTGHADHVAVGRWATAAWARSGAGDLLYAAFPARHFERFGDVHDRLGVYLDEPHVTPDEELALCLRLSEHELDRKRAALAAHESQTAAVAAAMGEELYREWVREESFRRPRTEDVERALSRLAPR